MLYELILLQLLAHVLADFVFQPQTWCNKKNQKAFSSYHFLHTFVVFVTAYLFSLNYNFWIGAVIISLSHLTIDLIKSHYYKKKNHKSYFFIDQIIHLGIIVMVSYFFILFNDIEFALEINMKTIAIITGFVFCTKPANILIKNIFSAFSLNFTPQIGSTDDKDLPNAGKLIGIMERLLTLALIITGQYEAVGLIIAAKSILRFNDTQKNEYILVGTLLSFGIAVLIGISINNI